MLTDPLGAPIVITDAIKRAIRVLKQASALIAPVALDSETQPASFVDPELRQLVEQLGLTDESSADDAEPAVKRRKVITQTDRVSEMVERLYEVIGTPDAVGIEDLQGWTL